MPTESEWNDYWAVRARDAATSDLPWRKEWQERIKEDGDYACFTGFEKWMGVRCENDGALAVLWDNADIFERIAIYGLVTDCMDAVRPKATS